MVRAARIVAALLLVGVACEQPNRAPSAPEIDLEPPMPYTWDDILLVIEEPSVDADGDRVFYSTRWFRNGEIYPDVHGDTIPAERTEAGEYWIAELWATDGSLESPVAAATVYVFNSPPEARVWIKPAEPGTAQDLQAMVRTEDLDGHEVELHYTWSLDGEATEFVEASLPAEATSKGQLWEVEVESNDGDSWGVPVRAEVSVLNTAPTAPSVAVEPEDARAREDDLQCVLLEAVVDPDGDALDYRVAWTVDGEVFEDVETSVLAGDTVSRWSTAPGQRWVCEMWADDGEGEGAGGRASVILGR
jgi:hypothetical protein